MEMVLVRESGTNGWCRLGVVEAAPAGGGQEGWSPWEPPAGQEFQDGDRLYPSAWWPTATVSGCLPEPAYSWQDGEWNFHGANLAPWEIEIGGHHTLPDNPPPPDLREALDHLRWSDTPAWRDAVLASIRNAGGVVVDRGDSVTIWSAFLPKGQNHNICPGECSPEMYEALRAGAIPVRDLRALRRAAVGEAARLCAASADPETARLIRTAYMPSVTEPDDDDAVTAARTAMVHLSALCADRWETWRSGYLPDGDPGEWTVADCGRAAVARVSSWAATRPRDSISRRYGRRAGATELLAEPEDVAIVPSGIRTDRTPRLLSAAVAPVIERWGDAEVRRWWDAQGIAPWGSLVRNGRVMHALEDPYDSDAPDRGETESMMADHLVRQMVQHLLLLLRLEEEYAWDNDGGAWGRPRSEA